MSNCKVFFAGSEACTAIPALRFSGAKYCLLSVFPFICQSVGLPSRYFFKKISLSPSKHIETLSLECRHVIMDSGLYTLSFGALGGKTDRIIIYKWFDGMLRFICDNVPKNITIVECDCQKVLDVDTAWDLRKKMREVFPDFSIMNVWHYNDGLSGLDRLSEFSSYIGLSIPELKSVTVRSKLQRLVIYLCHRVKRTNPHCRIHLLGCTDSKLILPVNTLVYSCDSTSWLSHVKYPNKNVVLNGIKDVKPSSISNIPMERLFRGFPDGFIAHKSAVETSIRWGISMKTELCEYNKILGPQD